jgi:hypothetical protein
MKKLLYTVLVAAMVLGFGTGAFGAAGAISPVPWTDIAGHSAEAELTAMAALGIFTGDSGLGGTVNPNGSITRAQFCKVVVVATGKASTAAGLAGLKPTFTDAVPAWAWGYVNTAFFMGVIAGYPDGSFKAENPVTYAEAITMLVKAIPQHKLQVPAGIWPYNFIFYAVDEGFTGAVDVGAATAPCTRGDMAKLLLTTMQVDPVAADGHHDVGDAILEDHARLYDDGFLVDVNVTAGHAYYDGHELDLADGVFIVGGTSYNDLLMQPARAILNTAGDVAFLQKISGTQVTGVFADWGTDTLGDTYLLLADDTKVYYVGNTYTQINKSDVDVSDNWYYEDDLWVGDELLINVDEDGLAVQIFANRWDLVYHLSSPTPASDMLADAHDKTSTVNAKIDFLPTGLGVSSAFYYLDFDTQNYYPLYGYSGTGLTADIPASAKVTINGALATANDLAKFDVIKGSTFGAWGFDPVDNTNAIIAISAERNAFQAAVTGMSTTYPGEKHYVTFDVGGTAKTYQIDESYLSDGNFNVGTLYKVVLANNKLFWQVDLGSSSPTVLVKAIRYVTEGGSTPEHWYIDVDKRGTATTYECDEDPTGWGWGTDHFYTLDIDNTTGLVDVSDCSQLSDWGGDLAVLALGAGNATMADGCGPPPCIYFFQEAETAVYSWTDTGFVFIGFAGLAVDDAVDVLWDGTAYVFIRDDSTAP